MESSTSGSIKRTRTPSTSNGCLVDGCSSDLSKCRDYHRRHKVCELHSKTPKVTIRGREQRFCQQCSRFHSLKEFDEGKRSCRKRLDWHNRRRRKPQPEPMAVNSARFLSSYQELCAGARVSAFDHPQILATGPVGSSGRAGCMKSENNFVFFNDQSQFDDLDGRDVSITESLSDKGERQFSILQGVNSTMHGGSSSSSQKLLFDGLKVERDNDSECALSLLSSTPAETGDFGWRHMMHPNNPLSPSFVSILQLDGLEMQRESTPLLVTQGLSSTIISSPTDAHLQHQLFSSW